VKPSADATHGTQSAGDPYVPDSGNGGYRVDHYDLDLTYRLETNRLDGTAALSATTTQPLARFSLDLSGLKVSKVTIDGRRAEKFATRGRKLVVSIGRVIDEGTPFRVAINYVGTPRPLNGPWGEVGWEELTDGVIVAAQPNGASSWFPCNDHPSNKATYLIAITTDSAYRVIATGTLAARGIRASTTRWVYEQRAPMASYLASVQIGRYELLQLPGDDVQQQAASPGRLKSSVESAFARQDEMIACFGETFGPYPFADYTVVVTDDALEIPVEAQGMSVFGANYLDGVDERLVAHELAHQWFGNSLTLGAWKDIWLHEGFACYAEWLWSEASGGESADELAQRHWQRLADKPHDLVLTDPQPESMFDDRVYKRGALTLHALRRTIGDPSFVELLRAWVATYKHATVSTEAFIAHVREHAGDDAAGRLGPWLNELKLPKLPAGREHR
jgi:aminopeptidase N